jgi:membrane protein required for colicin V production
MAPVDLLALTVLSIAVLRGFFLGLIREAFSLAAIAAAWVAVRWFSGPAAAWLQAASEGRVGELMAPWIAGAGVAIVAALAVALSGRVLRTGARAVGLGLLDRTGGALLGAAEGSLVIVLLLVLGTTLLGRNHPLFENTRTLAAFERAESVVDGARESDVAAPPPSPRAHR